MIEEAERDDWLTFQQAFLLLAKDHRNVESIKLEYIVDVADIQDFSEQKLRFLQQVDAYCLRNKVQKVSDAIGHGTLVLAVLPEVLSTIECLSKKNDAIISI